MTEMSLSEAAKWAGVTRPTIFKALKDGRLSGHKDEGGQWRIDPAELERVYSPASKRHDKLASSDTAALTAEKDQQISLLREMLEDTRKQRDEWQAEAGKWQAEAEAHTRLLTHQHIPAAAQEQLDAMTPKQRKGLFSGITRRLLTGRKA